jgi:hypothetical protein
MTEYLNQRQRVEIFNLNAVETISDDFSSIEDRLKMLDCILNFLYRDMEVVDATLRQMESCCVQQSIEVTNETGPSELQRSIDWVHQHLSERVSGQRLCLS